nr:WYL domain-containing protein [Haliscomenobacter sp.]
MSRRMAIGQNYNNDRTSNHLSSLQLALTNFEVTKIVYQKPDSEETSTRAVEPFALFNTHENWLLVAYCRLRQNSQGVPTGSNQKLEVLGGKI